MFRHFSVTPLDEPQVLYLCDCLILSQRAILTVTMVKFSPPWLGALVVSVLLDFGFLGTKWLPFSFGVAPTYINLINLSA
jgi:hypothetical protein